MAKSKITIVLLFIACNTLLGCGTKGPLYIPEQRYPQKTSIEPHVELPKATPQTTPEATVPAKTY